MKFTVTILSFLLLAIPSGHCQNLLTGKVFVSDKLEQIEFINDSALVSTTEDFPDRYKLRKQKLILIFSKKLHGDHYQGSYKIVSYSSDSIIISHVWTDNSKPDTTLFINIEKLIIPINNFDSLRIYMRGQRGYKILTLKNDKSINEIEAIGENYYTNKPIYKQHILTDKTYQEFLNTLSRSLIFKLPRQRHFTAEDESRIDITISVNRQILISNGGTLHGIHKQLLDYLLTIK